MNSTNIISFIIFYLIIIPVHASQRVNIYSKIVQDVEQRLNNSTKDIFIQFDHTTKTYILNKNCWTYDIDLSAVSVWNSCSGSAGGGTLINSRVIVDATHFCKPDGTVYRFVSKSGAIYERTLIAGVNIGDDIHLGLLNTSLPDQITKQLQSWETDIFTTYNPMRP